jgi:processive 1,2-diacylglycerol beta-glucosyltransferase
VDAFAAKNYKAIKYDFLMSSSELWNTVVVGGYKGLAFKLPRIYGNIYKLTNFDKFNNMIPSIFIKSVEKGILAEISRQKPDIIIGTHAFAVTVVSKLKKRNIIDVPFVSIVTDFKAHGSYIDRAVDAYITASEYTCIDMIRRDVPEHKVFPFGIPVKKEFRSNNDNSIKLPGGYFSVLLMGGGMGLRFISPVLKKLTENEHKLRITVVCGNNKSLNEALERKYSSSIYNKEIHILGFTKDVPELMDKAHVIITKPGGLTVTESIAKRLPMLLPYAIPGQEQENMDLLLSAGAAFDVRELRSINEIINNLIECPEKLNEMRNNLGRISKNYSIESIVKLSNKLINHARGLEYYEDDMIKVAGT